MSPAVAVAIIVGGMSICGTLVGFVIQGLMARASKREDWRRQDEVAESAAEVTRVLAEENRKAAAVSEVMLETLKVIHTNVNSNMTAEMKAARDALVALHASLKEIVRLNRVAGNEPTEDALLAIESTKAKIAELNAQLAEREGSA